MEILEETTTDPVELVAMCRELANRIESSMDADPSPDAKPTLARVARHVKMASKLASELDRASPVEGMFPDFRGELAAIISQQLGGMKAAEATRPMAEGGGDAATRRTRGAAGSTGFHGDTRCLALPELIGCLSLQRKDGVLTVAGADEEFSIWFAKGDVVHAISSHNPPGSRLGEILVAQGALTSEELKAYLSLLTGTGGRLGDMLQRENVLTFEPIRTAIETQLRTIFHRLYAQTDARYSFYEGLPQDMDERIRLDATYLLLESARQSDEKMERGPAGRDG